MPLPTSFVVKNGSKARACTSGGMPGPVSPTSTTIASPSTLVAMRRTCPCPSIASMALSMRFVHTWFRSPGSLSMRGASGA